MKEKFASRKYKPRKFLPGRFAGVGVSYSVIDTETYTVQCRMVMPFVSRWRMDKTMESIVQLSPSDTRT